MKRVVLIGFDPTAVDFSDPALPPGIDNFFKQHQPIGWQADTCTSSRDASPAPRNRSAQV